MAEEKKGSNSGNLTTKVLVGLLVVAAFFIGSLYTKVQTLEKGNVSGVQVKAGNTANNTGNTNNPPPEPQVGDVPKITDKDHIRGNPKAKIALIEYSDFECPFCKRFHPTAQQVLDEYGDQVMWVYRHFPLDQIHPKARKSAEAAECANELGGNEAFWKMADAIFEAMPDMSLDDLPTIAGKIGLNQAKFKSCLDSGKFAQHVEDDRQGGARAGVTGTPGNILLNVKTGETKLVPGAVPFDSIKSSIDQMLSG